ncbi:MAG TPA: glycosyl transferase [Clostridiales bacterium]|nr:glycosyl transferase [Clostridiales bacterium]
MLKSERARSVIAPADKVLCERFGGACGDAVSAQYISTLNGGVLFGVSGLSFPAPVCAALLSDEEVCGVVSAFAKEERSLLISKKDGNYSVLSEKAGSVEDITNSEDGKKLLDSSKSIIEYCSEWGGKLNEGGELICDLSSPAPGPHYYTNLLIGNRIGFDHPLQSTPKSAIDRIGGGCFRSHADTQVLATRWDYLPEQNGFPANRQFYLVENGQVIFYSGSAKQDSVEKALCRHSQNRTVIEYTLKDGLKVRRTIFILPQEDKLPVASEAQLIEIENSGTANRDLRIVYTGMFGTQEVHALREDVIFSTVVAQSEVFYGDNDEIRAISFNPNPKWTKGNIRYNTLMVHDGDKVVFPDQFCARYADFVGAGTLEKPQFAAILSNSHSRKGPGFFALSAPFTVKAEGKIQIDNFTCLSSDCVNENYKEDITMQEELEALIARFTDAKALPSCLDKVISFAKNYSSYMQIKHADKDFEAYVNNNLPFQVFYQTFVSRSLDWTQKGYREIGFREIQDIFASMYYFAGMGEVEFIKKLLREWISNIHEDGFANHNFYWKGKEPGWWSDDALWLLQALDRFISLTGDYDFLKEELPVAGEEGKKRSILETIKTVFTYSYKISVGAHGIPLIDRADWNDCLRVDPDCIGGADKIEAYKAQLASSGKKYGEVPYESEYSESVMNGCLLKVAVDAAIGMFRNCGDEEYASFLEGASSDLKTRINEYAWKGDYFARVLFNRKDKPNLKYLGAQGDGLVIEDGKAGTYFLNSFSWAVLADCASEEQISTMLDSLDKNLRTPFGFRLCTGVDYPQIAPKIDVALYYQGDRENGGIFKHANMMAAAAMLKASKSVNDQALAERLAKTAFWVIDCILPYRTLKSPFTVCGNPRLCTQYNNSETGENIGPTLSGTSTWLLLCLFTSFGVDFTSDALIVEPILRPDDTAEDILVSSGKAKYHITVDKPQGFRRTKDGVSISVDGAPIEGVRVPIFTDGAVHEVQVKF